ncbi:putative F-box/FBD/LRR-repeat protein At4g13965 [Gastrolobium bilobum]|uniref:putative F-box/FBD/LRR-repeat protein At4g13965 n=1 Tax=Gastrolobium bilobum TaxID=150636 RepID=UPI002AAF4EDC|nr:putative F-box/FBD/LRR-repeat protein At4g13965 [Gastrolobium bilobum]
MKIAKLSENNEDRLSDLPDCVLTHLMSFLPTQVAVQTCILSRRWKGLWKRLFYYPCSENGFEICFLSYDIQQLKLTYSCNHLDLPPSLFLCQTLTSLDLTANRIPHLFPKSLNLTALTSLRLQHFTFGDSELVEPFSSCIKLKTLVIHTCVIKDTQILCISNATLVKLTIDSYQAYKIVLSTPNLCSFAFSGVPIQHISSSNISSIKQVNIAVDPWAVLCHSRSGFILFSWLQLFANVRSLTLYSSTLQVLSSIPDLLNTEAPCLGNLKSLIVKVKNILPPYERPGLVLRYKKPELKPVPVRVVDYLIRNSPFAEITIINCEGSLLKPGFIDYLTPLLARVTGSY